MNDHSGSGGTDARAVMVYDGDCEFCKYWIERWRDRTGSQIDYRSFQETADEFPKIPRERFENAVQLVEPDGVVTSGADAVFRAMELAGRRKWWPRTAWFLVLARGVYRFVADHREVFSLATRLFFGRDPRRPTYLVARWLFVRLLGLAYFFAFVSLALQVRGLIGKRGILPVGEFLDGVRSQTGPERYWLLPTVTWLNSSDAALMAICVAGSALAIAVMLGVWPAFCLFLLWVLFLSMVTACRIFFGYQWDALLLETGLLAIFLTGPLAWRPAWGIETRSERIARWLLLWLVFRLMFESGVVKLASADAAWRNLTALTYHYETQPLPIWTSWYANQAPLWFQKVSCGVMFAIELVAPFAVFGPRNIRRVGAAALIALQGLIAATGNYCYFNLLGAALSLLLLDDAVWPRWMRCLTEKRNGGVGSSWPLWTIAPVVAISLTVTSMQLFLTLRLLSRWPQPLAWLHQNVWPLRSFNSYGLFAVMTTSRPEIIVEGSADGEHWIPYEFKWKPGDLNRRPGLVAPMQPRLDWQMWFAALGSVQQNSWFLHFVSRLLEGAPEVVGLLASNPFPDAPPKYVRAVLCDFKFTRFGDDPRAWWKRIDAGVYCPALELTPEGELRVR